MVAGAVMIAEKKLSVEGNSEVRKVGVKCKNRNTCSSRSEMELVESEVPAVRTAEFRSRPKDDLGTVGVRFVERMYLCFLVDTYVVSGWVEERLGTVGLGNSSGLYFFVFPQPRGSGRSGLRD